MLQTADMSDNEHVMDLNKLFVREFQCKDGSVLKINQSEVGDVGCVVWDAAIVLASYLQVAEGIELDGRRVLELGAGPALVGLQAACLRADCVITDLDVFLPLIQLNVDENKHLFTRPVKVSALHWGTDVSSFLPHPDYILLADCIYYEESMEPLVQTLCDLSGPGTVVLCCHEERTTGDKPRLQSHFFKLIGEQFDIRKIPLEQQDPVYRSPDIHIHHFTKKS